MSAVYWLSAEMMTLYFMEDMNIVDAELQKAA